MTTYNECLEILKNRDTRKVANNTYMHKIDNDSIGIRLHDTDVVTVYKNNSIKLDSGGWLTVTTKSRINEHYNTGQWQGGISQKAGVWYMHDNSLFYDGVTINKNGRVVKPRKTDKYEKKLKEIKKQAKEYSKKYVQALKDGLIDYPNGGDCWYCLMFDKKLPSTTDVNHIKEHIKDNYFVPSLLVNAGRDAGYRDEQIGLMGIGGQRLFIEPDKVIYKYIVKRLQGSL